MDCPSCGWHLGVNPSWCFECEKVEPTWERVESSREPSRPCKACGEFAGHPDWEGLCAGCLYFSPGDPHGRRRKKGPIREIIDYREPYPPRQDRTEPSRPLCRECRGYLATSPDDRLCDGCAYEASGTSLTFGEWKQAQAEATRQIRARKRAS